MSNLIDVDDDDEMQLSLPEVNLVPTDVSARKSMQICLKLCL